MNNYFLASLLASLLLAVSAAHWPNSSGHHQQLDQRHALTGGCKTDFFNPSNPTNPSNRAALGDKKTLKLWPNNVIPYEFDSSFTKMDREVFEKAVKQIEEAVPCIKFREKEEDDTYHVLAKRNGSCLDRRPGYQKANSWVSPLGAANPTLLNTIGSCFDPDHQFSIGHFVHELMHVLGFTHTQKRDDRDKYIVVTEDFKDNHQFSKCGKCKDMGVEYDCLSIMHYRDDDGETMRAIDPDTCDLSKYNWILRPSDIEMMKIVYCNGNDVVTTTTTEVAEETCQGNCGLGLPSGCYCDDKCKHYNDCCSDYNYFCLPW